LEKEAALLASPDADIENAFDMPAIVPHSF